MQNSPSPNKAQILVRLGQAADRCRALQATWQVRRAAAARDRDQKALERELNEDMVQVIEPLQGLGVDDLDALFGAPRPQRHMPVGWEGSFTRNRLYTGPRSGWGAAEQAVRREEAIDIYSAIDGAYMAYGRRNPQTRDVIEELISVGKLDRETAIPVYEAGQLTSHWVEAQVLSPRAYHVDHIHSLAEHWKDTGHDSTDAERWSVATDPGNLRLITQRANLQKGARGEGEDADYHRYGHQKFVGPNFRSWLADGGIPNALNLDNMPFVDEKGDPLPS